MPHANGANRLICTTTEDDSLRPRLFEM